MIKFEQNYPLDNIGGRLKLRASSQLKSAKLNYPYVHRGHSDIFYVDGTKEKIKIEQQSTKITTGFLSDVKDKKRLLNVKGEPKIDFQLNCDKVNVVLKQLNNKNIKNIEYIVIVRHYTVLKDVYCGAYKINKVNEQVNNIQSVVLTLKMEGQNAVVVSDLGTAPTQPAPAPLDNDG
jgi:hypothetical protein